MSYENYLKEIKVKIKCIFFTYLSPNVNYPFFNWTLFILDKAVLSKEAVLMNIKGLHFRILNTAL